MSPMQKMNVAPIAKAMIPLGKTDQIRALGITTLASCTSSPVVQCQRGSLIDRGAGSRMAFTVDVVVAQEMLMRACIAAKLRQQLSSFLPFTVIAVIHFFFVCGTEKLFTE